MKIWLDPVAPESGSSVSRQKDATFGNIGTHAACFAGGKAALDVASVSLKLAHLPCSGLRASGLRARVGKNGTIS